eukprot:CAMPEP_0202695174 /NCGR_PEP_ID=MMETSP1385-20130828/8834_1 /ASSEMBLY_ACC=CAM_ASM_000861 /TAXON_ID=933848 /ORGANISM="Elphidium margaritaceum" /LENGTH=250 /DNA_ID=CAMNT_0049351151 /DNA_START=241 /DNA_END=993 /DNA_ORIENTATION=+
MYAFVVAYTLLVGIGSSQFLYGKWLLFPQTWCHIHIIPTEAAEIAIGVWILMDMCMCIVLCFMFVRPLKRMLMDQPAEEMVTAVQPAYTDRLDYQLTAVYLKYAILTCISVFLNVVSMAVYLFKHLTILIEVVAVINCICIMLMHVKYAPVLTKLCGGLFHYCVDAEIQRMKSSTSSLQTSRSKSDLQIQTTNTPGQEAATCCEPSNTTIIVYDNSSQDVAGKIAANDGPPGDNVNAAVADAEEEEEEVP